MIKKKKLFNLFSLILLTFFLKDNILSQQDITNEPNIENIPSPSDTFTAQATLASPSSENTIADIKSEPALPLPPTKDNINITSQQNLETINNQINKAKTIVSPNETIVSNTKSTKSIIPTTNNRPTNTNLTQTFETDVNTSSTNNVSKVPNVTETLTRTNQIRSIKPTTQTADATTIESLTEPITETTKTTKVTKRIPLRERISSPSIGLATEKDEPTLTRTKRNITTRKQTLPSTSIIPSQDRPGPKKADIIIEPKKKLKANTFSMADTPKNLKEKVLMEKEINAIPSTTFQNAPKLDPKLIEGPSKIKEKDVYLAEFLEPWRDMDPNYTVEMNFDNTDITALLDFLKKHLKVDFILDDDIGPKRSEGLKPIAGTKISFKSHIPLTLKEVWELGLTFLDMADFAAIPTTIKRTYHVTASSGRSGPSANTKPLPTFIGTDLELLPDSDAKVRYVYFVENAELDTIAKVIDTMRSGTSGPLIQFPELKAIIITDKASNIKSLATILSEIDTVNTPETLAIIRLKHADADDVVNLYKSLIGKTDNKPMFGFRQKKQSTTTYFTESTRVIPEPRTNSLIILGSKENIKKFEDFIFQHIDKKSELPYSPLHIITLKYIDAESTSNILNGLITDFNNDPSRKTAAAVGGVRDGNQFFKPSVRITPEQSGNRLIINADYDEYLKINDLINKLDIEQPQVAIKVLILNVDLTNLKQFGSQTRNSVACCDGTGGTTSLLGPNINFQYAGLGNIITRDTTPNNSPVSGAERLLGNLINLANLPSTGAPLFTVGSTLVTLGQDIFGFWGLLRMLEAVTRVSVVANPFLITTHKYKAEITVGETRRVLTAFVQGQSTQQSFGDLPANLSVVITPQISYDDMVTLNIYVELSQFTSGGELPTISTKQISTEALVANKEVIALGGLVRETVQETLTKVPILGDIPLVGWLFKNKQKIFARQSILILICPEIIKPNEPEVADEFTNYQLADAKKTLYSINYGPAKRDPIHRWFFKDHDLPQVAELDNFNSRQAQYVDAAQKKKLDLLALDDTKNSPQNKNLLDIVKASSNEDKKEVIA